MNINVVFITSLVHIIVQAAITCMPFSWSIRGFSDMCWF